MSKAVLNVDPIEGVGVVGGPYLVGVAKDAEVRAASSAGTGFDFNLGMLGAKTLENVVQVVNVLDVNLFLGVSAGRRGRAARRGCPSRL